MSLTHPPLTGAEACAQDAIPASVAGEAETLERSYTRRERRREPIRRRCSASEQRPEIAISWS